MSIYPSLEDMKFDQLARAQNQYEAQMSAAAPAPDYAAVQSTAGYPPAQSTPGYPNAPPPSYSPSAMYPSLGDYMGLELSEAVISANMPEYNQIAILASREIAISGSGPNNMVAPLSGQSLGLQRAQVSHGIRELILCKDKDGKVGVRVKPINNGIFVCLVIDKSPAALAGLRFGDQIIQISGQLVAGYTMDKVHELFRKSAVNGISVVVRDRPFERTLTLHKDSTGHIGFQFKNGKIFSLVKDSSAAKNGLLTEHHLLEVEGQNVVGLKDKEICKLIDNARDIVTITIIPSFIYEHMIKKMSNSLLKDLMDHSIPML